MRTARDPSSSPTGIRQLAQSLGISIGTVSRALNNRYGVNPRTRAKILEEARRIGYVANSAARALKDRPVLTIGLFFAPFFGPNREINPAALTFVETLRQKAVSETASLQTIFFTSDADLKAQAEANHLDVAILYGQFSPSAFETVQKTGIPAVIMHFHSKFPNQVSVCHDMHQAAANAVEYLAALGHERIGLVTGPHGGFHAASYEAGFIAALEEFGLPYRRDWNFELPAEKANKFGSSEALSGLLCQKDRPTAIVFSSDWMALGARLAAKEANLRVPEDLSLIGFENMPTSAEVDPPLTTFDIHFPKVAELVVDLAMKLSEQKRSGIPIENKEILMTPKLIKRQSCVCLRTLDN